MSEDTLTVESQALEPSNIAALAEEAVYQLPGCSDLMVRKALQRVFREYCRATGSLVCRVSRTVSSTSPAIALCSQYGDFYLLTGAVLDDEEIDIRDLRPYAENGMPKVTFADSISGTASVEAVVTFSVIPRIGSDIAPYNWLNLHGDAIVSGMLAELMAENGRPWFNPAAAVENSRKYWMHKQNYAFMRLSAGSRDGNMTFTDARYSFAGSFD